MMVLRWNFAGPSDPVKSIPRDCSFARFRSPCFLGREGGAPRLSSNLSESIRPGGVERRDLGDGNARSSNVSFLWLPRFSVFPRWWFFSGGRGHRSEVFTRESQSRGQSIGFGWLDYAGDAK